VPDMIQWTLSAPMMLGSLLFGYLCGSIPFGLILTRMAGLGDVRKIGSGNIGATNVLRTGNKKLAAPPCLPMRSRARSPFSSPGRFSAWKRRLIAGLGAFLGHLYPVWLKFKGGKGVATYLGVLLGLAPLIVLVFAAVWLGMAKLFRFSSLAALAAAVAVPIALYLYGRPEVASLFVVMSLITILKHHENIRRLVSGTESRIGDKG
jgi:glycerol-3-phosphate acyltransferase PlsY